MEQQEQVEWDDLNKLLQHHGFKPVYFADPVENKNISELVLLDKKSAGEIRTVLRTMLTDSERRQALIQELARSNNQLKEDIHKHMSEAAQQSRRATELEGLLDSVKTRVQELEDRYLGDAVQQHNQAQRDEQEKQGAQKLCEVLEKKLSEQREETAQLQKKLYFTIKEEEKRVARQNRTFRHICKQVVQQSSPVEQQVLEVIDFYETKMKQLQDEIRSVKKEPAGFQGKNKKSSGQVTPSFKLIVKAYQEQLRESRSQMEDLQRKVENLKRDLEMRSREDSRHKINENLAREARLCASYHQLLNEVNAILTNPSAPLRLRRQKPSSVGLEQIEFQNLLPTLEVWAQQFRLLKDLHQTLNKLSVRLMPWELSNGVLTAETAKVEDMMLQVDMMLENTSTDDEKVLRSPTRFTLASMVSHFQKLFDVTSLSGVFPRMNEVYTRLGEMTNAMRNIRDVLELDSTAAPAEVVNQVSRLVSSSNQTAGLQNLLGDADIDSIIVKVKTHEEFFPAFHTVIMDILETLGVSSLDEILPALNSLKTAAQ